MLSVSQIPFIIVCLYECCWELLFLLLFSPPTLSFQHKSYHFSRSGLELVLPWPRSYCLLAQGSCLTPSRISLFYGNFKIQVERFQNIEMGEKGGREDKCFSCIGCDMQNWRALWNSHSSLWTEEQTKPFDSEGKTEDLEEGRGRIKIGNAGELCNSRPQEQRKN